MITTAAILASLLIGIVVVFQVALAVGVPWGAHAWGGRQSGRLPARLRVASGASAAFLLLVAWIVLAQGGVLAWSPLPREWLAPATWVLTGLLALNTLSNLASRSPVERFGLGGVTAVLVLLCGYVAASGSGPG